MNFWCKLQTVKGQAITAIKNNPLLSALLLFAFLYRLSGIFWGLPPLDLGYYHPDEPKIIHGAYNFPADILSRVDLRYPTACHYILGILTWPVKAILKSYGHEPFFFVYLSGRLLSVILGTATVLMVFLLGRREFNKTHGLIAATALAFSMFHVANSAWATTDVATSFLLTLFVYLVIPAIQKRSSRLALASGVTLGMLVGAKYTGALAIIPFFILLFVHHDLHKKHNTVVKVRNFLTDKYLWIIGLSSIVVFLISTPGIILHFSEFLSSIKYEQTRMAKYMKPMYDFEIWLNSFLKLGRTMGLPLAASACIGVCITFITRTMFEIALLVLLVVFFVYFNDALAPRYLIMIMPLLSIFVARALLFPLLLRQKWVQKGAIIVGASVLLHAFLYSSAGVISRYPDTRTTVSTYVRDNIPPESTIGIAYTSKVHGWQRHKWRYPKINFNVFHYLDFLHIPEYIIVSYYDAVKMNKILLGNTLNDNFVYPKSLARHWYRSSPPEPLIFKCFFDLYFSDEPIYERIARFIPKLLIAPIEFPPPTIDVFKLKKEFHIKQESNSDLSY